MARPSYRAMLALIAIGVAGPATDASAQAADVRIAIYAPWSGPSSATQRHAFGLEVQAAVSRTGLGSAKVSSYAKLADLRRAISRNAIDLVLCDAMAATTFGKRARVLASWTSDQPWVLAAVSAGALRGRRLALQAPDAPTSKRLVARLLRGQLPTKYWSKTIGAPVSADARQLVMRNKADIVLLPRDKLSGLTELVDLGTFSELTLVQLGSAPASKSVERFAKPIKSAVLRRMRGSWSKGAPRFPAPAAITALRRTPVAASNLSVLRWLSRVELPAPPLAVKELWIEPDAR